jgi:hypothetical protein
VAALRATDAAGEEVPGAAGGIGQRDVDNVDELSVARGKRHGEKDNGRDDKTARLRADPDKS